MLQFRHQDTLPIAEEAMEVIKETESTPATTFEPDKDGHGTLRISDMEKLGLNSTQLDTAFVSPRMSFDGVQEDMFLQKAKAEINDSMISIQQRSLNENESVLMK